MAAPTEMDVVAVSPACPVRHDGQEVLAALAVTSVALRARQSSADSISLVRFLWRVERAMVVFLQQR